MKPDCFMLTTVKVNYKSDIDPLVMIEKGDWIDLRAAEDVNLKAGEFALVSFGFSMDIPYGLEAIVAPRSSTFKKYGIIQTNSIGVIDNSYSGFNDVWKLPVYATRDTFIPKNERIAQFRFFNSMRADNTLGEFEFKSVDKFDNEKEDRGGFGSTDGQF